MITSEKEKGFSFATCNRLGVIPLIVRKGNEFVTNYSKNIQFVNVMHNQLTSVGSALIPFLEHDDANRALMGSGMQKQSISLLKRDTPVVQTGLENFVSRESGDLSICKEGSKLKHISSTRVVVKEIAETRKVKNLTYMIYIKIKKQILFKLYKFPYPFRFRDRNYFLKNFKGLDFGFGHTNIVENVDYIRKGQVLTDNRNTKFGKLSLGRNLLIGYLSFEGYNFEDAIIINRRLIDEDIFTSIHVKKYQVFLTHTETGKVRANISI